MFINLRYKMVEYNQVNLNLTDSQLKKNTKCH